jgi:hypothetical protein
MVGESKKVVLNLLLVHALDLHVSFFKMTMGHNSNPILCEESDLNPLTRMQCKVSRFPFHNHKLLKLIKLAKIIVVLVLGSVENERNFNIVAFMKTKL